jgi:hypothetical protein
MNAGIVSNNFHEISIQFLCDKIFFLKYFFWQIVAVNKTAYWHAKNIL